VALATTLPVLAQQQEASLKSSLMPMKAEALPVMVGPAFC
jgi:hypothetical protein